MSVMMIINYETFTLEEGCIQLLHAMNRQMRLHLMCSSLMLELISFGYGDPDQEHRKRFFCRASVAKNHCHYHLSPDCVHSCPGIMGQQTFKLERAETKPTSSLRDHYDHLKAGVCLPCQNLAFSSSSPY